ncbi:MAG TPA: protein kinase, partial [Pyrinomonadaceae bacterium]|nr:protein kinase [Pyrinomonadaceae bacterium]
SYYRIISKIGSGGMGEVYLAEDARLHRKVALKIPPTERAANKDRMRRFEQEAIAAAALNHPNIATIHDIGAADGTNFIAIESSMVTRCVKRFIKSERHSKNF